MVFSDTVVAVSDGAVGCSNAISLMTGVKNFALSLPVLISYLLVSFGVNSQSNSYSPSFELSQLGQSNVPKIFMLPS
jgi:hypothetical protein